MKVILINRLLKMQITLECEDTLKAKRNLAHEAVKIASKHTSSADNHSAYWVRLRDYHDISDFLDISECFNMEMTTFNVVDLGWVEIQVKQGLELTLDKVHIDNNSNFICSDEVLCFDGVCRNEDDCLWCDNIQHFAPCEAVVAGENGYEYCQNLYDTMIKS